MKILKITSLLTLSILLTSCNPYNALTKEYTSRQILDIYSNYDFIFTYYDYSNDNSYQYEEYISITNTNNDQKADFYFFENEDLAYRYADEHSFGLFLWLFSLMNGNASQRNIEYHGKMVVEYDDASLLKPLIDYENNNAN